MKLRNMLFLVTSIALALVLLLITLITRAYYVRSFSAIERAVVQKDIDRLNSTLHNLTAVLSATVSDWSSWSDTYQFVQDRNQSYIDSNIYLETFQSLSLNYMLFINRQGEIVFSQGYDLEAARDEAIPADLAELATSEQFLAALSGVEDEIHGFCKAGNEILALAARPILLSKNQGPPAGVLLFAYNLGENTLELLSDTTQLPLNVLPLESSLVSEEDQVELRLSQADAPVVIETVGDRTISSILLVRDVNGEPAFYLRFDETRTIYIQGLNSVNVITVFVLLAGILSAQAVFVVVEYLVVSRLNRMTTAITDIRKDREWKKRVPFKGKDTIATLAQEINRMLDMRQKLDRQVRRLAHTDGLTGLLNRRTMDGAGEYEINRARRNMRSLSIMMIDLDHFKDVNDKNNHSIGDQVLKGVARILKANTRDIDYLCRYGGDEFAIIMPDATDQHARIVAERLRSMIEQTDIPTDGGPQHITASLGVTTSPLAADDLLTLYKQADEAMYAAKDTGRNRVVIFQREDAQGI